CARGNFYYDYGSAWFAYW
nr:immunoglobulin heavy chain junction region [Mus musculus]NSM08950.1 immunoglobulin heavy chain junction region [Mus musculus]NSM09226.1 immunoglobulin heavy chain junction region [Mus musculus]NSM09270.1 immunoglobulin heavy chain junction region [Mus musculus]